MLTSVKSLENMITYVCRELPELYKEYRKMVTKIKYGNTNTFIIRGTDKNLLIDTDYAGTISMFYRAIKESGITVKDIDYVLATHFHPDHIGLISELMEQGVKLLLIKPQVRSVHYSDEIFSRTPKLGYKPIDETKAVVISVEASRDFLEEMGIKGEIIHTPSHSEDSISVVLDEGICIVGDLEPYEYIGGYDQNKALESDWDKVLSYNPSIVYYAHANEKQF